MFPSSFDQHAALFNVINITNRLLPLPLSDDNVTVGVPAPWGEDSAQRDTKVTISAIADKGFVSETDVFYQRTDIGALFALSNISPTLDGTEIASWNDLLGAMNTRYNTVFTEVDIPVVPFSLPTLPFTLTLVMPPTSLLFKGQLDIALTSTQPTLMSAVTVTQLDGLTPPHATIYALSDVIVNTDLNGLQQP